MSLVVARTNGKNVSLVSDTLITKNGSPLPREQGVLKTCAFPFGVCVGFAGDPDYAKSELWKFSQTQKPPMHRDAIVKFFEKSSAKGHCDYLVCFARSARIVKITLGKERHGTADTQWIGDKPAYEIFREIEAHQKPKLEYGRATSSVFVWNEPEGSPTSNLYSTMRQLVRSRYSPVVGGFPTAMSSIDNQFRPATITDVLFDWPDGVPYGQLDWNYRVQLRISGENEDQSTTMFGTGYGGVNLLGIYYLAGHKAIIFHPKETHLADNLTVLSGVRPEDLPGRLKDKFGVDLGWQIIIGSGSNPSVLDNRQPSEQMGMRFGFKVHCNTFSRKGEVVSRPDLEFRFSGPTS